MTAFGSVEAALEAIKEGAYDYVSKPLRLDELLLTVRRALTHRRLFYRLNVVNIHLPPLRERREDIASLSHHFLRKYAKATGFEMSYGAWETPQGQED